MYQNLSGSTKFLLYTIAGMILLLCVPVHANSTNHDHALQQRIIRGKVSTADDGLGFPGANVIVKGTSNGTVTDSEGNYSLEISSGDAVILVSAIGYATREVTIGSQSVVDVILEADVTSLGEIVVVGYGTVKKSDVTGAVVKMTSDQIAAMPVQNTLQALQGRAAGIDVTSNARPGELGTIRIRGTRSLLATNDPLYVVDGIPLQSGGMVYRCSQGV
jgi:TonB-dependent starch-binding outer membrane protein SusC